MFPKHLFSLIVCLFSVFSIYGQSTSYAREVVNQLTDSSFHGRGYVEAGDQRAAEFVQAEFSKWNLKSFGSSYQQEFFISVNAFPGKMNLEVDGKSLVPGQDFLVDPASVGISGEFDVLELDMNRLNDSKYLDQIIGQDGKFLSYHTDALQNDTILSFIQWLRFEDDLPFKGLIERTSQKLTWGIASYQLPRPFLRISSGINDSIGSISLNIENQFLSEYQTQNVVGYIEGDRQDSVILLMAHYDHLGRMGKDTFFPGANDNASGTAMLLNLARYFSENKPSKTLVFVASGAEEVGLLGAKHYVSNPSIPLEKIQFMLNFDIAGTGDDGIQVVNGSVYPGLFRRLTELNDQNQYLPDIKVRGAACISDHCLFDQKNIPSFYIYTLGGIQAYHDIYDRRDTLPLTEFEDYLQLMIRFIQSF